MTSLSAVAVRPIDAAVTHATAEDIKAQKALIYEVMREVMVEGIHYGRIAGMPKPVLLKPGAEVLCSTFRIAPMLDIQDLSTSDSRRFRVICTGQHQGTKIDLGQGVGECSTDEAKYKWRAPVCPEEFEEAAENMRRVKWMRGAGGKPYRQQQLRTEPADASHTVLSMATKRALVAMVRVVTAAGDVFSQAEEMEGADTDETQGRVARRGRTPPRAPQSSTSDGGPRLANEQQRKLIFVRLEQAGMSAETLCKHLGIDSIRELQFSQVNDALTFIANPPTDETSPQ